MQIITKLTNACNFACVYCSEGENGHEYLPQEIFFKLVDDLPELMQKLESNQIDFLFHGGEPLLYGRDKLEQLINYAQDHLKNFELRFLIQTNGSLIDDDWIELFKKYDISPGISFDGYPELHDENRIFSDGRGTSEKILENMHKLRDADIHFGSLMVLNTTQEIDVDKLFEFIKAEQMNPKIHSVIPCGRADSRSDSTDVYKNYTSMMKKIYSKCVESEIDVEPLDELMNAILEVSSMHECSFAGTCGTKFMCLYSDGVVGFCGRDDYARNLSYGNLKDRSLTELYESSNAEKIRSRQKILRDGLCKNCSDWDLCHGGCSFEAVNASGELNSRYPFCSERREFLKYLRTDGLEILKQHLINLILLNHQAEAENSSRLREI